ncbi:hypothetical protein [Candidatus Neptunochlamydia vexilliferae]|uniref:Uncharacterized protein n=1 Tax=Candidatus Neptunichlamydia vexilliferae TaxID=1651774 RepID=A0ABS0AYL0_9BACT|nr:hypothetical protein [Candidatus Neptunochlamydia vexilliferae]MBF5059224.1 hypothetical protein [Candidatus Neptunochlamydia vexilliferae]
MSVNETGCFSFLFQCCANTNSGEYEQLKDSSKKNASYSGVNQAEKSQINEKTANLSSTPLKTADQQLFRKDTPKVDEKTKQKDTKFLLNSPQQHLKTSASSGLINNGLDSSFSDPSLVFDAFAKSSSKNLNYDSDEGF